jgi:hypothetical protein
MTQRIAPMTAFAALAAGVAFAAAPEVGQRLGVTLAEIGDALAAEGYEMPYFEREGNRIEVYAY